MRQGGGLCGLVVRERDHSGFDGHTQDPGLGTVCYRLPGQDGHVFPSLLHVGLSNFQVTFQLCDLLLDGLHFLLGLSQRILQLIYMIVCLGKGGFQLGYAGLVAAHIAQVLGFYTE